MLMDNLSKYLNAINMVKQMKNSGILTEQEYNKAEAFFSKKYCIKIDCLFRPYDLINSPFRVIYSDDKKEV